MSYNKPVIAQQLLLPKSLHKLFHIELRRLNEKRNPIDLSLFDSRHEKSHVFSTNSRPYLLPCVYIGEIWRFRLLITNISQELNISDFSIHAHVNMHLKTATQLYPRPREVCPSLIIKGDSISIDMEYPVTSNEPTHYQLIFTIRCSATSSTISHTITTSDTAAHLRAPNTTYNEYFQFHALPAVSLQYQKQTLGENLFVEALITNVTSEPQLPLSVNVNCKCMGLFQASNLSAMHSSSTASTFSNPMLLPTPTVKQTNHESSVLYLPAGDCKNVLFQISLEDPTSLVNLNALSVGQLEVQWRTESRYGMFLSELIRRQSLFCRKLSSTDNSSISGRTSNSVSGIEVLVSECPSISLVHQTFSISFNVFNLDRYRHRLWLSIDKNTSGYLLPIFETKKYLGLLEPHSSVNATLTVFALQPGIHVLTGIVIDSQRLTGNLKNTDIESVSRTIIHYESSHYIYIDVPSNKHLKNRNEMENNEQTVISVDVDVMESVSFVDDIKVNVDDIVNDSGVDIHDTIEDIDGDTFMVLSTEKKPNSITEKVLKVDIYSKEEKENENALETENISTVSEKTEDAIAVEVISTDEMNITPVEPLVDDINDENVILSLSMARKSVDDTETEEENLEIEKSPQFNSIATDEEQSEN